MTFEYTDCLVCGSHIPDTKLVFTPNGGVEHCIRCWQRCCSQHPPHQDCPRRGADIRYP